MEAVRDPGGQFDSGDFRTADVGGVQDHDIAAIGGCVVDGRQDPSVVLGGAAGAAHEDRFAGATASAMFMHRARASVEIMLDRVAEGPLVGAVAEGGRVSIPMLLVEH